MKTGSCVALLYDFDKTLCTKDMQEYTFLPQLGLDARHFWDETERYTHEEGMDPVLAYMYLMLRKMRASGEEFSFRREDIRELGRAVEFFPGVRDWFGRMRRYGEREGVHVEHYIISSGLKEIIEGSAIAREFRAIFASEFHYDRYGAPDWPLMAVNYTGKTQYLFRINKGVLDISDNDSLNRYQPENERRIPFRNMIYIGDGMTDVPCMKLVRSYGGTSIAVYTEQSYPHVRELLKQERVNVLVPADYREGKTLDKLLFRLIRRMADTDKLLRMEAEQREL